MMNGAGPGEPYTRIPNATLELLARSSLTGRHLRIVLAILRLTIGWSRKNAEIPITRLSQMTMIDRRKCHVLLRDLVLRKVINRSVAVHGNRKTITYCFNEVFTEWRVVPPTATGPKPDIMTKKGNASLPSTATKSLPSKATFKEINKSKETATPPGPHERVRGLSNLVSSVPSIPPPVDMEARRLELRAQAEALRAEGTA